MIFSSSIGLCPFLYSYSGQFLIGHSRTSLNCPLLQSKHFALIALIGVNFAIISAFPAFPKFRKAYFKLKDISVFSSLPNIIPCLFLSDFKNAVFVVFNSKSCLCFYSSGVSYGLKHSFIGRLLHLL